MNIIHYFAGGALLLGATSPSLGQSSIDRSFDSSPRSCADVRWSAQVRENFPNISDTCQSIQSRNGKSYVMLEGEVEQVINGGEKLRIDFQGGNEVTLVPPRNTSFYIDGKRTSASELTPGTDLNFYIPEDRFQAEMAGATASAPFIVIPIEIQPIGAASSGQNDRPGAAAETGASGQSATSAQSGAMTRTDPASRPEPANAETATQPSAAQGRPAMQSDSQGSGSAQAGQAQSGSAQGASAQAGGGSGSITLVLIPSAQQQVIQAANTSGCWTTLYSGQDFKGDALTLVGPVELKDMVGPFGLDWDERLESIRTGPNTWVTMYDNEGFRDRSAKLQPGAAVSDVDDKLGLFEEVQSMKVSCKAK